MLLSYAQCGKCSASVNPDAKECPYCGAHFLHKNEEPSSEFMEQTVSHLMSQMRATVAVRTAPYLSEEQKIKPIEKIEEEFEFRHERSNLSKQSSVINFVSDFCAGKFLATTVGYLKHMVEATIDRILDWNGYIITVNGCRVDDNCILRDDDIVRAVTLR